MGTLTTRLPTPPLVRYPLTTTLDRGGLYGYQLNEKSYRMGSSYHCSKLAVVATAGKTIGAYLLRGVGRGSFCYVPNYNAIRQWVKDLVLVNG